MLTMAVASSCFLAPRAPLLYSRPRADTVQMGEYETITVGDSLPSVDVELSTADQNIGRVVSISDILGPGRSILLGMPGAFTPTCQDKHLPSFYENAKKFADLGVSSINVVTYNDRWVNDRWQQDVQSCTNSFAPDGQLWRGVPVQMISDPRGDLLEGIGMIAYLGRDLGIRSKRFALVLEDGVAKHVAVDEGSELLEDTSADKLLVICEERLAMAAAEAELAASAELSFMDLEEALAYLSSATTQAMLKRAGVDDAVVTEALTMVEAAASAVLARRMAVQAVAAELTVLGAAEAFAFLSSARKGLVDAGVEEGEIAASLAIIEQAIPAGAAVQAPSASVDSSSTNTNLIIGGVVGAAAVGLAIASQMGVIGLPAEDLSAGMDSASSVVESVANSL